MQGGGTQVLMFDPPDAYERPDKGRTALISSLSATAKISPDVLAPQRDRRRGTADRDRSHRRSISAQASKLRPDRNLLLPREFAFACREGGPEDESSR